MPSPTATYSYQSVPPKSLAKALDFVKRGGTLCVRTAMRTTIIDRKVVDRFEKAGATLLTEEGDGYRIRFGKASVYLLPGQLEAINVLTASNNDPLPTAKSQTGLVRRA